MGLSTKLFPGDHELDWSQTLLQSGSLELPKPPPMRRQQQQPQSEPLKCPRCGSTNTKFCYYNNYNKTQPRHLCKACKRHWTKGGTLRNVPVGGGRKNKRLRRSNAAASTTTTITNRSNAQVSIIQSQQQSQNLPVGLGNHKSISDTVYQALISPQSLLQDDTINSLTGKNFMGNNGNFMCSTLPETQNESLQFSLSSISSFDTNPSSIPIFFQSSNAYKYTRKLEEDASIATTMPSTSSIVSLPWQVPATSSVIDMPNYWNWGDIDTMVSADLNIPWDDTEINAQGS